MQSRFTIHHDVDLKNDSFYLPIDWNYYPGHMSTYHDPEVPESVEFLQVTVPDELEHRREEVEWAVEDKIGELEQEALEYIHGLFERTEVLGNEYA